VHRVALAVDGNEGGACEIKLREIEADELVDAQAGLREQGEDGEVARTELSHALLGCHHEHAPKLGRGEDWRIYGCFPGERDTVGRAAWPAEFAPRELRECA